MKSFCLQIEIKARGYSYNALIFQPFLRLGVLTKLIFIWKIVPCPTCVKSIRIRSFFGPYFPAFGLDMEIYSVNHAVLISVFCVNDTYLLSQYIAQYVTIYCCCHNCHNILLLSQYIALPNKKFHYLRKWQTFYYFRM